MEDKISQSGSGNNDDEDDDDDDDDDNDNDDDDDDDNDDNDDGLETCAARNMDLSGGRQAEARGSAFVAALRNSHHQR